MRPFVVGQEVHMSSGVYGLKGKVSKVTPWGVEVDSGGGLAMTIACAIRVIRLAVAVARFAVMIET